MVAAQRRCSDDRPGLPLCCARAVCCCGCFPRADPACACRLPKCRMRWRRPWLPAAMVRDLQSDSTPLPSATVTRTRRIGRRHPWQHDIGRPIQQQPTCSTICPALRHLPPARRTPRPALRRLRRLGLPPARRTPRPALRRLPFCTRAAPARSCRLFLGPQPASVPLLLRCSRPVGTRRGPGDSFAHHAKTYSGGF